LKAILDEQGHRVITARNGSEGLEMVKQEDFALIFLGLKMPRMDGAELFVGHNLQKNQASADSLFVH